MTLLIEIGIAIFLVFGILCAKPEYGLFLYGFALGFPDAAIPVGTSVNIRFDDALLLLFLLRSILCTPAPLAAGQRKILGWQASLLLLCISSAVIESMGGTPPEAYETLKMIGCAAIIFVLPRLVQSRRRLRFLIAGLMSGGMALVLQVVNHLDASSPNRATNFQEYKSAAAFATWNPNTIGQAAMLVVFAAGVGWIVFAGSQAVRIAHLCLGVGFALIPAMTFVRGTSLSIAAGFLLFLCLSRRWKWALMFIAVCLALVLYLRTTKRELADDAFHIDLTTGEGFSGRYERWDAAIEAIRVKPFLGHGFGQEWNYLQEAGSEGRAHNAYLTVWIELGLGGLALLLAVLHQFVSVGLALYRRPEFHLCGALILALIFALCLDSIGLGTLYWEKLPTISLSIAVALAGICERNELALVRSNP